MSAALLRKEAHEHGIVLAAAFVVAFLALLGMSLRAAEVQGGRFVGLAQFSLYIGPFLVLVLANRLIVREYGGRTQLFLETLPIGRLRVFLTKWLTGCALAVGFALIGWALVLRTIRGSEVLTFEDARAPLYCFVLFWVTLWSFGAFGGMLGRYRYVLWGTVVLLAYLASDTAGIAFYDLPVLRLIGEDVQQARGAPSSVEIGRTAAIAVICFLGAAVLALKGSGAMASALAKRMTARERVFVLVAFMTVMTAAFMLDPKPVQPPFAITDGVRAQGRSVEVGVLPTADLDRFAAQRLAATLAADVDALAETFDFDTEARVFVLPQQGLDRHTMERAYMIAAQGVVLKVAPDAPHDYIRAIVTHSVLGDATFDRGMREDRHVLFDGFSVYFAVRDDAAARDLWTLRATAVGEHVPTETLTDWAATSERFGECVSLATGYNAVAALADRIGLERTTALMRQLFGRPHNDARVLFERSPDSLLADAGMDWTSLAAAAEQRLAEARRRFAERLAARPRTSADVRVSRTAESGTTIETEVTGVERHYIYYSMLGPWTADVGGMPRLDVLGTRSTVPISPPRGARLLVVAEYDDPVLDCPVRVLARRLDLP